MSQRSHIAQSGSIAISACSAACSVDKSVGITERGFAEFEGWVADTAEMVAQCPCTDGCPSCVQSPKCGNLNDMLDKAGAATLLARLVSSGA